MKYRQIERRISKAVNVGGITIGAGAPISIQSMTTTQTADVKATLEQINRLAEAGCDLVRVAAATKQDTSALSEIVAASPVPIIADVHFNFERALEAIHAGVHKIRLNPGTISDRQAVRTIIKACKDAHIPIRVGVNEGSVIDRFNQERREKQIARPLDEVMIEAIEAYLEIFHECDFYDLVLSAKSHDAATTIAVNRELARKYDYPLHLGLTHAGTVRTGSVRSICAVATLLAEGIGDTIRISLAGDPVEEVALAKELLAALRLREPEGVEIIACPTCGRTTADVAAIADQLRQALADIKQHITVAVMGCVVNGPGEAGQVDVALCCGKNNASIFREGKFIRTVPMEKAIDEMITEVRKLADSRKVQK